MGFQEDAPAAEVGHLLLQRADVCFTYRNVQIHPVGGEPFFQHQSVDFGQAQFDQGQFAEAAAAAVFAALHQQPFRRLLQALVGAAAISPGQAAGA
ncbi:hypothetical protein D3C80_1979060 [compost metagenome]